MGVRRIRWPIRIKQDGDGENSKEKCDRMMDLRTLKATSRIGVLGRVHNAQNLLLDVSAKERAESSRETTE